MSPGKAIARSLRRFATFSGRAPRSEYWWFLGFYVLGGWLLGQFDALLFDIRTVDIEASDPDDVTVAMMLGAVGPISTLFSLVMLVPLVAVGWRRMHDTGRRGLYLLYPLLVAFGITLFVQVAGVTQPALSGIGDHGMVVAIILAAAMLVLLISPLIVLFWLTRPSEPRTNEWGPLPAGVRA